MSSIVLTKSIDILLGIVKDSIKKNMALVNLKFIFAILSLILLFLIIWRRMANNMKMDIVKALWILNILPTTHLTSNLDFIREIKMSSLAT